MNWTVTASCGGRFPAIDPVFFSDRTRVAVASALAIKVFQLGTRQMVAKIAVDCTDAVQIILVENDSAFLIVRKSGSVDRIGVDETECVRLNAEVKVKKLLDEHTAFVASNKNFLQIGSIKISSNALEFQGAFESSLATADSGMFSASKDYAVFMAPKTNRLELFSRATGRVQILNGAGRSSVTSIAVSSRGLVAIGNSSGVIDMIYHENMSIRTMKWHLEPVLSLQFSLNDEYLLSGGHEKVLVFWQLATNRQQFLPRLDGSLTSICTNDSGTLYGLTLDRDQLVVISAVDLVSRLNVAGTRASFTKLPPDHQAARRRRRKRQLDMWVNADYTAPLRVHPGTRNAYLLGNSASAQVYSLVKDEQEAVLRLARTADAGKVRLELEIEDPKVNLLEFSEDGQSMVTADVIRTPRSLMSANDLKVCLRFWQLLEDGTWVIKTRVESPHGVNVEVLGAQLTTDSCVTVGKDGSLRLWKRVVEDGEVKFVLKRVGAPFGFSSPFMSVAWSGDHSLLALACDTSVFLVNASTLKPVRQLPNVAGEPVRGLLFAQSSLVVLDRSRLLVFDLVSYQQRWSIELHSPPNGARLLTGDLHSGRFTIAVNYWTPQYRINAKILQFSMREPVPLACYTHSHAVSAIDVIPGTQSLCFIDQRGVLLTLAGTPNEFGAVGEIQQMSLVSYTLRVVEPEEVTEGMQALDVNAVGKLFEGNLSVEQAFDRVMGVISAD